jgi:hypothetical protein
MPGIVSQTGIKVSKRETCSKQTGSEHCQTRAGPTVKVIESASKKMRQVQRYTDAADQARLARNAMARTTAPVKARSA